MKYEISVIFKSPKSWRLLDPTFLLLSSFFLRFAYLSLLECLSVHTCLCLQFQCPCVPNCLHFWCPCVPTTWFCTETMFVWLIYVYSFSVPVSQIVCIFDVPVSQQPDFVQKLCLLALRLKLKALELATFLVKALWACFFLNFVI